MYFYIYYFFLSKDSPNVLGVIHIYLTATKLVNLYIYKFILIFAYEGMFI